MQIFRKLISTPTFLVASIPRDAGFSQTRSTHLLLLLQFSTLCRRLLPERPVCRESPIFLRKSRLLCAILLLRRVTTTESVLLFVQCSFSVLWEPFSLIWVTFVRIFLRGRKLLHRVVILISILFLWSAIQLLWRWWGWWRWKWGLQPTTTSIPFQQPTCQYSGVLWGAATTSTR